MASGLVPNTSITFFIVITPKVWGSDSLLTLLIQKSSYSQDALCPVTPDETIPKLADDLHQQEFSLDEQGNSIYAEE